MIVDDLVKFQKNNVFSIIIGSGPAGISTALELERKKIKTLIIEAGDIDPSLETEKFLKGNIIGDEYSDISISRLRQFGGASGHWGGNCNPMDKEDLHGWPIKKNELDIYEDSAKKILNLHHFYKKNFFLKSFSENLNVFNLVWSNVRFADKYLEHIKKSEYINLSLNTSLLNFNGNSKTINSINCSKNQKIINLKSKYYILSCGGIENSRMLLWSKKINDEIFEDKLPIGQYYMDHPKHLIGSGLLLYDKFISYLKKKEIQYTPTLTCNDRMYISAKNNFIRNKEILNAGLYLQFEGINERNDLFKQVRCIAPNFIKNIYENLKVKKKYKISINIIQEQEADIKNKIVLDVSKDPLGIPYPLIYWKKSKLEKKSARLIAEDLSKLFVDNDIGRIALEKYMYNDEDYDVVVGNHQLGGTRIGVNSDDSVVDKNLKIHGKDNLYINGSSVFRTGGHSHPTYTIVKLAVRLADHLSKL